MCDKDTLRKKISLIINGRNGAEEYDIYRVVSYFKRLVSECNNKELDKEIAEIVFELYPDPHFIFPLAIAGNKKTEKYLKIIMEKNVKDVDIIFECAIGLAALNIDEGFDILDNICKTSKSSPDVYDVYDYLEYADNPRVNKMKVDILKGYYYFEYHEFKKSIYNLLTLKGYELKTLENEMAIYSDSRNNKYTILPYIGPKDGAVMVIENIFNILSIASKIEPFLRLILYIKSGDLTVKYMLKSLEDKSNFYSNKFYDVVNDKEKLKSYLDRVIIIENDEVFSLNYE